MEESLWWATCEMCHFGYRCLQQTSDGIKLYCSSYFMDSLLTSKCHFASECQALLGVFWWVSLHTSVLMSLQINIEKKLIFQIANPKGLWGAKLLSEIIFFEDVQNLLYSVLPTVKCVHSKMYFLQTVCHQAIVKCVEQLLCYCSHCIQ